MTAWLESTALATWTRESSSIWAYPTILTLHTVGLGIVVGACTVIDLRLLGVARRMHLAVLEPLFAVIWWAFALNAATGVLLFIADATRKSEQPVFYIKLATIALAVVVTIAIRRIVLNAAPDGEPPSQSRALATTSLVLWAGAITAGRLMAYL